MLTAEGYQKTTAHTIALPKARTFYDHKLYRKSFDGKIHFRDFYREEAAFMFVEPILKSLRPLRFFINKYFFVISESVAKYKSVHYALSGAVVAGAAGALYEDRQAVTDEEKIGQSLSELTPNFFIHDRLRKQKLTASVYKTMGIELADSQVHVVYDDKVKVATFSHRLFSRELCVKLPENMYDSVTSEAELIASAAKQAAQDKEHHRCLESMISGATAGFILKMARYAGSHVGRLMPMSYILALVYLHQQLDYRSDTVAVKCFPDYADKMVDIMRKRQENQAQLTDYHQGRALNIMESRNRDNLVYEKTYAQVLKWISLHRCRFDRVQPTQKFPHPLTRALKDNCLHLNKTQNIAIHRLSNSARVYLPEEIESVLRKFFEAHKEQGTLLGQLYCNMSFSDFVERLVTKTYQTVYLDGGVLYGRKHAEDRLNKALPKYPHQNIQDNLDLLIKIGTLEDADAVFYDYLTLEEIGIKSLLIQHAVCLPVGDGRRDTEYLDTSTSDTDFRLPIINSMTAAVKRPVLVSSISGIEARNGHTVHPDLFMIFAPKAPNKFWEDRVQLLRNSPYYLASKHIYGDKLAIDQAPDTFSEDKDFFLFGDGKYHEEWYVCKSAYKNRMKVLYRGLLQSADQQMQAYGLGHSFNLKGLGLGYFGFSAATHILEGLSKEALHETLAEIKLEHIQQINLINWPSQIAKTDPELPLHQQAFLRQIDTIGPIKIFEGIAEAFAAHEEAGELGGTHVCADAAAQFGNEAHIGMPPSSSDDAATYYALLDPTPLIYADNPDLSLRLR